MAAIDNVVAFNVVIQDAAPSRQSFGIVAVLAHHGVSPERLVYETTPDGRSAMLVDGFTAGHDAYRKNLQIGSQSPKVPSFKLYNRAAPNAQTLTLTPTILTAGRKYVFEINGIPIAHTNGPAETPATIVTALKTQLNLVPNVTATGTTTVLLALTAPAGERMYLKKVPRHLTFKDTSLDAGIATDLAAALAEDSDFYGVLIDSNSELEINAAVAWCHANGKIFHGHTLDSDVVSSSTTDVASDLMLAGLPYGKVYFSRDMVGGYAAAIMGRQFSRSPGSTTWENQRLANIEPDDLNPTEIANAVAKRCGLYLRFGLDAAATFNTVSSSGRFLDITRDADWLVANAQADIYAYLLNQERVDFTQSGVDGIEGVLRARFTLAEDAGVLDADWKITLPSIADIDPADKALRQLVASNSFSGIFKGAIHGVDLSGVLAV